MVLAIDFDGVIHDYKNPLPGRKLGGPITGSKEAMHLFKRMGHKLIIHSVWGDKPQPIKDWLRFYGIPFDEITRLKPNADLYIDDKGFRFTTWISLLESGVVR